MINYTDEEQSRVNELDAIVAKCDSDRRDASAEKRRIKERARQRGKRGAA